jgi:hypothetical protein
VERVLSHFYSILLTDVVATGLFSDIILAEEVKKYVEVMGGTWASDYTAEVTHFFTDGVDQDSIAIATAEGI